MSNFGPCFGFHFWAQKWNPKQGPKLDTNQDPKMQSGACMNFIQRSAGRSDSIVQETNNFNQRRKGNLGGQNCLNREHEYIHKLNVVKTCFTCRRYTVKSHAGENHSMLATMGVRPCVTAKLPVLRPWFWNLILLNLAPASCYFIASLVGGLRCNASRLLRMC